MGTRRATSNPATAGDKFNATPSDAWSDLPTLPWTCTLHKSGTLVRTRSNTPPALWVGPLTNWEQSAPVAKSKAATPWGISDAWSQPLWVVTVEITHKTKDRLRINWLDAPHSFTKTIKHSVIRTWASIHNKQTTIQPLTRNLSDHELTTRTLEPFSPRNRKTRANKQRHTKPIWASTSQLKNTSFETREKQLRHMPKTSYLSLGLSAQATTSNLVAAMASSSLVPCRPLILVNITLKHCGATLGPGLTSTSGNRSLRHP